MAARRARLLTAMRLGGLAALLAAAWHLRAVHPPVPTPVRLNEPRVPPVGDADIPGFVTVSHILILHNETSGMLPVPALRQTLGGSSHTRAEARSIADEIAASARRDPLSFAALARAHSEDFHTAPEGGSLGTLSHAELPSEFTLALRQLAVGQVSGVIETALGYHVLWRRPPPRNELVAGREVVIAYWESSETLLREGHSHQRSRRDAEERARLVARLARSGASSFSSLVDEYSDSASAARGGDVGAWRIGEAWQNPRELEVLAGLPIGGVSDPLDTPWGFKVLMRTDDIERTEYAVLAVLFPFAPEPPESRAKAASDARVALEELRRDPSAIDAMATNASSYMKFTRGRELIGLMPRVDEIEIGKVALEVIEAHNVFTIVKRLDPQAPPPPRAPETVTHRDLETVFSMVSGPALAVSVREFAAAAAVALQANASGAAQAKRILEGLAEDLETGTDGAASYRLAAEELRKTLGEDDSQFLLALAQDWSLRKLPSLAQPEPAR